MDVDFMTRTSNWSPVVHEIICKCTNLRKSFFIIKQRWTLGSDLDPHEYCDWELPSHDHFEEPDHRD